jgi:Ca-activated chloride channel family protein
VIRQIAEASGGLAVFTNDVKQLDKVYQQIAAEIQAQYTLGYVSTNDKRDGSWRRVEVRVTRQSSADAKVRARRGYFAPYAETAPAPR